MGAAAKRETSSKPTPHTALTHSQFIEAYADLARASEAESGVPALVTLAQAGLESGWGERVFGFNFFGIKANASAPKETRQLLRTHEDHQRPDVTGYPEVISITRKRNGRYDYYVRDWFRVYPSVEEGFRDHGRFLVENKNYRKAFGTSDPYAFASEIARGHYATDSHYEETLHATMRTLEKLGFH